jgi:hypothetical protein
MHNTFLLSHETYPANGGRRLSRRDSRAIVETFEQRILFAVTSGPVSQLIFLRQPTDTTADARLAPTVVEVEDASGQIVKDDQSEVSLSIINNANNTQLGAMTARVKHGRAVFSGVGITPAGTYFVEASDASLTPISGNSFTISGSKPKALVFSQAPSGTVATSATFSAQLQLVDRFGNSTTDRKNSATIGLRSSPKGAILSGTLTDNATNGTVNFVGLSLDTNGTYALEVKLGKLKVISPTFVVAPGDNGSGGTSGDTTSNSFILPYTADVLLTPIGGDGGSVTEFGLGTSETNTDPLFTGLPNSSSSYGPTDIGVYTAGSSLNVYMKTAGFGTTGYAFSNDVTDVASRVAFMDLSNALGLGGSIYTKVNDTTYVMNLDDALSYPYDDDNNDVLIRITLVPVSNQGNSSATEVVASR